MFDIFLSYADEDRPKARELAQSLQSAGWSVWWDRRIPSGKSWRDAIEAALAEMRCMVVLWSRHSIDSDWVCEEADEGRRRSVLAPVLIERVEPPLGFRSIQAADLSEWDGAPDAPGLRQLFDDLEALVGKPAAPAAAAAAASAGAATASGDSDTAGHRSSNRRAIALIAAAIGAVALIVVLGGIWPGRQAEPPTTQKAVQTVPERPADEAPVPASPLGSADAPEPAVRAPATAALPEPAAREPATAASSEPILVAPPASPPRVPAATTARTNPDVAVPRPRSSLSRPPGAPRCAAILERQSLGERPSAADLDYLNKECR